MIIDNPVLGNMRNSIGGIVFYPGKSGQTARVRNNLISNSNPYKKLANYQFSSLSKSWRNLTTVQKVPYGTFADSGFVPLKRTNTGQYSGYQCYVSLNTMFRKVINNVCPTEWFWTGQITSNPPTLIQPIPPTSTPPHGTVSFDIPDSAGGSIPLGISNIFVEVGNVFVIEIFRYVSSVPAVSVAMRSSTNANYVIGLYLSNEIPYIGATAKNKFMKYLGNCEFGVATGHANWLDYSTLRMQIDCSTNVNRMKYPPRSGSHAICTAVAIDAYGSAQIIGSFTVTL